MSAYEPTLHNNNIFQYHKPHKIPNTSITVPQNNKGKQPYFHRSSYETSDESILDFFIEKNQKTAHPPCPFN